MANWATINKRRKMRESGSEDRGAASGDAPTVLAALFRAESARSARLDHYLEYGPRGERDVEGVLDARQQARLPSGQTRAERDLWLRGILDAE